MPSEKLFEAMGLMHRAGNIQSFADILRYIKPGAIAKAIGLGGSRFSRKAEDPATFTHHEIGKMATLFGISEEAMKEICRSGK